MRRFLALTLTIIIDSTLSVSIVVPLVLATLWIGGQYIAWALAVLATTSLGLIGGAALRRLKQWRDARPESARFANGIAVVSTTIAIYLTTHLYDGQINPLVGFGLPVGMVLWLLGACIANKRPLHENRTPIPRY